MCYFWEMPLKNNGMPLWSILSFSWNGKVMARTTDTIWHNYVSWDKRPYIVEDQMERVQVLVIVDSGHLCKWDGKQKKVYYIQATFIWVFQSQFNLFIWLRKKEDILRWRHCQELRNMHLFYAYLCWITEDQKDTHIYWWSVSCKF